MTGGPRTRQAAHGDTEAVLRSLLQHRILVLDGGMGTLLQAAGLTADDFGGAHLEGCNENLVRTRPDVIENVHRQYLDAGADVVETDTFGATSIVLAEYGLEADAYDLNVLAARCARRAVDAASTPAWPRFVAGSIGPTTKSLSVTGGTTFEALQGAYEEQARGLLDGGVDLLLVETVQDTRNCKAAALGIEAAFEAAGRRVPLILSATVEPTGTMLGGQDVEAWYTSIAHLRPLSVGMNCATGPEFMTDHLRTLASIADCAVHVYPNAGLPDDDGCYPETPELLAKHVKPFVEEGWVNLVGGCCGTTPDHVRALRDLVDGARPRVPTARPSIVASGIETVRLEADNRPILVGERTNVIGSLRFKRLVEAGDWERAAEVGRAQVRRGAQVVDVCLTHPDRDEVADIESFYPRLARTVKAPWMVDSTDATAIEAALKHCQGKAIVNSINLEDGEERFEAVCPLLRRYGAAVVVGTIDEDPQQGMAVTAQRKLEVARRSHELLTRKYGIPPEDILFDPLVFPCGTGDEAYRGSAGQTIEGVRRIAAAFPDCGTILGVSNVSFGLPEAGREVLNSVFLHDCVQAGLTHAIVNTQGIERYADIPEEERALCRALLYDEGDDPLGVFVEHFGGRKARRHRPERPAGTTQQRLARYVVEGTKEWLLPDLDERLAAGDAPLDIINGPLMEGMAEVGRLFAGNQLIVAEVLQSAEVMKAAVRHLEPHMESATDATKGRVLLATVKGDVHDIGKNLVEIILSNNGYRVTDLGIKVPPERIIQAVREHRPDVIGLSGLLVKSAHQMVTTAQDLRRAGIDLPLVVGGAALSATFTANRIQPEYGGVVAYARDAMGGLGLLDRIRSDPESVRATPRPAPRAPDAAPAAPAEHVPLAPATAAAVDHRRRTQTASPRDLFAWINPRMLYGKHMGLRGDPAALLERGDGRARELEALWDGLLATAGRRDLLRPRAVWRFWPASRDGDAVLVHDPETDEVLERFPFQRQAATPRRCLSDYLPPTERGRDTIATFVVTAGHGVRGQAQAWKEEGEYLRAHGIQALALETAEAYAERLHADLRAAWGFPDPPETTMLDRFKARYRGRRYSFGYPACPDLSLQEGLWRLLHPEDVGVELTEGHMMDPEASVSAVVFHHPEATYFAV